MKRRDLIIAQWDTCFRDWRQLRCSGLSPHATAPHGNRLTGDLGGATWMGRTSSDTADLSGASVPSSVKRTQIPRLLLCRDPRPVYSGAAAELQYRKDCTPRPRRSGEDARGRGPLPNGWELPATLRTHGRQATVSALRVLFPGPEEALEDELWGRGCLCPGSGRGSCVNRPGK